MMDMRRCTACNRWKPEDHYSPAPIKGKAGLHSHCRDCRAAHAKHHRARVATSRASDPYRAKAGWGSHAT
jgi:hypothetical protein